MSADFQFLNNRSERIIISKRLSEMNMIQSAKRKRVRTMSLLLLSMERKYRIKKAFPHSMT